MEIPQIGMIIIVVAVLAGVLFFVKPDISPNALAVGNILPPSNPFVGKVTRAMEKLFVNQPQAVIEDSDRAGLLLPGGNSIQFTTDAHKTTQDVVIILNATNTTITDYHTYPEFVDNEFTYVPADQLRSSNPYILAQYPNGYFLMPVNVED